MRLAASYKLSLFDYLIVNCQLLSVQYSKALPPKNSRRSE